MAKNAEFPLRRFIRCGACGTPLTGSFSTGRHGGKYAYYFCRVRICHAVKFRRDDLHLRFTLLLESLCLKPTVWPFFEMVMSDVWKMKHAESDAAERQISKRTTELGILKDQISHAMVTGKLKQQYFDEQILKVEAELSALQDQHV
jgi:hypothetical protein